AGLVKTVTMSLSDLFRHGRRGGAAGMSSRAVIGAGAGAGLWITAVSVRGDDPNPTRGSHLGRNTSRHYPLCRGRQSTTTFWSYTGGIPRSRSRLVDAPPLFRDPRRRFGGWTPSAGGAAVRPPPGSARSPLHSPSPAPPQRVPSPVHRHPGTTTRARRRRTGDGPSWVHGRGPCRGGSALAGLEPGILLVDHEDLAVATDNLGARLVLQRPKGLADLHLALLSLWAARGPPT